MGEIGVDVNVLRHTASYLLAYAVKDLFPDVKLAAPGMNGDEFYYDFCSEHSFSEFDLAKIEKRMFDLAKKNESILCKTVEINQISAYFEITGERYKVELLDTISGKFCGVVYISDDFVDLCLVPLLPSTGNLGVFKLTKVSGVCWNASSQNDMLQRIYGTAWESDLQLKAYLERLAEAERQDHRRIGQDLNLFHFQDDAPGLVFWHANGWNIWLAIEKYLRQRLDDAGYTEVRTPQVLGREFWERSGHWQNYKDGMFFTESDRRNFAIKPMSCPGHVQIFNQRHISYRELPIRLSEFGVCHRNEPSGALHGLMRVRGFTQDDAHIFCDVKHIFSEVRDFNQLALSVYRDFGFDNVVVKLSLRPDKRVGSDDVWDRAESTLRQALASCNLQWVELTGEGAFYGPKIEYHISDALGRSWQCGTLQLDFVLPDRLAAEYIDKNDVRVSPVLLHRAILGSFERFIGILLEHYGGILPIWLAPIQVLVINISDDNLKYSHKILRTLEVRGVRVKSDFRNEKISYKIREGMIKKIPYLVVLGSKEQDADALTVRAHGSGVSRLMKLDELVDAIFSRTPAGNV